MMTQIGATVMITARINTIFRITLEVAESWFMSLFFLTTLT